MEISEELQSKYQQLGLEYQKTRAQVTVLKKAVIDEQTKNNLLQETLKKQDQSVRKFVQDIDSLEFRNSQLSKRVEVLQEELDKIEKKGLKHSKASGNINFIHEQELQMKISENESLHKQLTACKQEYEILNEELEEQICQLKDENERYLKTIEEGASMNNMVLDRLKEENVALQKRLVKEQDELKLANIMAEKYQNKLKGTQQEMKNELEGATKLLHERMLFIDTRDECLNELNLPVTNYKHYMQLCSVVDGAVSHSVDFMAGLSDYHSYLEQRLQVYSLDIKQEGISELNKKFSEHLLVNAKHSRNVQQVLRSFNEQVLKEPFLSIRSLPAFGNFLHAFKLYVRYLERLLPFRILSINDESQSVSWSDALEECNVSIIACEKKIVCLLKKVFSYMQLLSYAKLPDRSFPRCVSTTINVLQDIRLVFKKLHCFQEKKADLEHELPTYTERLKTTDDCLLSTLFSLQAITMKVHTSLQSSQSFLSTIQGVKRKGLLGASNKNVTSAVKCFTEKASSYLQKMKELSHPTSERCHHNLPLITSSPSISHEANFQEAILKLEEEKENLMLQVQVNQAKYEKEVQKSSHLIEELKMCKSNSIQRTTLVAEMSPERRSSSISSDTSIAPVKLGTVDVISKRDSHVSMATDNEALLKGHMTSRISELTKQLQLTDSKCVDFYHEAHTMYKQLVLADLNKQKLSNNLIESGKKVEALQDELDTTKRSYEEQLHTLTDHLCRMNETLTTQKDEIDDLKNGEKKSSKLSKRKNK